jgi:hypothetical protein
VSAIIRTAAETATPFSGRALLIFPETNSLELVRAVVVVTQRSRPKIRRSIRK